MKDIITITVFSENKAGLLQRVTTAFTRRKINIESLTVSESEIPGISRYTILVKIDPVLATKIVAALEKQVDIQKSFWYADDQIINREIAMYKFRSDDVGEGSKVREILEQHGADLIVTEGDFAVAQLTGRRCETQALYEAVADFGMLEFCRSGLIAISKRMKVLQDYLAEVNEAATH